MPPQILVRSFGENGTQLSAVLDNLAVYNDFVPLVYGTAWYQPPIVFARNDGNLTRMEVLLGMGEIEGVVTVLVNDIQIPRGAERREHDGDGVVQPGDAGDAERRVQSGLHGCVGQSAGRSVRQHGDDERGGAESDQQRADAGDGSGADATGCSWSSSIRRERRWANRSRIIRRGCCWMCCGEADG